MARLLIAHQVLAFVQPAFFSMLLSISGLGDGRGWVRNQTRFKRSTVESPQARGPAFEMKDGIDRINNIVLHTMSAPDAQPSYSYVIDSDLHTALASPGRLEDEIFQDLQDQRFVEELLSETVRLDKIIIKTLPAAPWYPSIWIALGIGSVTALLFLLHFFS